MDVVINHMGLDVDPTIIGEEIERTGLPAARALPGFRGYFWLRNGPDRATAVICWDSAETAQAAAAVLGPTWFNEHVFPHLLGEQDRTGGEAIVAVMEGGG